MSGGGGAGRDGPAGHEPVEPDAPTRLHGQDPKQSHAGNGTVNHGPDDQSREGLDSDELDLRTMLQQAVQDVEPRDGTLDYLRRAVPQRRTRKRQAVVGMAAAALFIGTAVPALVHVSNSTGSDANPSVAGHASATQGGGASEGKGPDGGESTSGGTGGKTEGKQKDDKKDKGKGKATGGASTGASQGAGPSATVAAGIAACTAAQLGPAAGSAAAPDSTGAVYGSFRVTNVSAASCTVTGPGSVSALPQGAADPGKVGSARHVAGDAAFRPARPVPGGGPAGVPPGRRLLSEVRLGAHGDLPPARRQCRRSRPQPRPHALAGRGGHGRHLHRRRHGHGAPAGQGGRHGRRERRGVVHTGDRLGCGLGHRVQRVRGDRVLDGRAGGLVEHGGPARRARGRGQTAGARCCSSSGTRPSSASRANSTSRRSSRNHMKITKPTKANHSAV
ncbi:conserved hypothetical protein [Streptomyces viridochromogenes DSM 40736]|uniref:DUF4232 domain-containing protein n=1 Tax=Streptomyces viridochromogenes (strain DSM 40736 / JCM 4977 / BCRC 1201 / Tue 494) TaxID=591159 RepID=D9X3S4_STRVT|nr:conserved hypothetical protein [Streptomyces viridochromogenes DSM 40736]